MREKDIAVSYGHVHLKDFVSRGDLGSGKEKSASELPRRLAECRLGERVTRLNGL